MFEDKKEEKKPGIQDKLKELHKLNDYLEDINKNLQILKSKGAKIEVSVDNNNAKESNLIHTLQVADTLINEVVALSESIKVSVTTTFVKRRSELLREISTLSGQLTVQEEYTDE